MSRISPEKQREYTRNWRGALRAMGRCIWCGKRDAFTMRGRSRCGNCVEKDNLRKRRERARTNADKSREWHKKQYEKRKAERRCTRCGKPLPPERSQFMCKACSVKMVENRREWRANHCDTLPRDIFAERYPHLCTLCRKEPRYQNFKLCETCYNKQTASLQTARAARKKKSIADSVG